MNNRFRINAINLTPVVDRILLTATVLMLVFIPAGSKAKIKLTLAAKAAEGSPARRAILPALVRHGTHQNGSLNIREI